MSIIETIEKTISPLIEKSRMELVDVEFVTENGERILRVFIDKEGGFNLSDCEAMSESIGALLDETEVVKEHYILEVSSPGIDRVLKKEKDFRRFTGQRVRLTIKAALNGHRNFCGPILSVDNGCVIIDDVTGKKVSLRLDNIVKARLAPLEI